MEANAVVLSETVTQRTDLTSLKASEGQQTGHGSLALCPGVIPMYPLHLPASTGFSFHLIKTCN